MISGNQIVSAANVLPLTTAIISGEKLGIRHRAVLGLTAQSMLLYSSC
ncbi:diadenylate cyclase [Metabacillus fastidiosus]